MQRIYIYTARLKDAPQVRISSSHMSSWASLESCIEWCKKHTFSFIIKELEGSIPKVSDKTLYDSDKQLAKTK